MSRLQVVLSAVVAAVVLLLVLAVVGVVPLPRKREPVSAAKPEPEPEAKPEPKPPEPKRPEPPVVRRVELPEGFEEAAGRKYYYYAYSGGLVDVWIEIEAAGKTTEAFRLNGREFLLDPATDAAALGGSIYWAPGAGPGEFVVVRRSGAADGPNGALTQTHRLNDISAAITKLLPPPAEKLGPLDATTGEFGSGSGGKWILEQGKPVTLREYWGSEKTKKVYTVRLRCQLSLPPKL